MGGKALGGQRVHSLDVPGIVENLLWGNYTKEREPAPRIEQYVIAGSFRRKKADCGDIDIVVEPANVGAFDSWLAKTFGMQANGKKSAHTGLIENIQVEFYVSKHEDFGSQLQMWTGSVTHNILLRSKAKKMGFSMSQYGLKNEDKIIHFAYEIDIYDFLKINFVNPENR